MRRIEVGPEIEAWLGRVGEIALDASQIDANKTADAILARARRIASRWTAAARSDFQAAREAARAAGEADGRALAAQEVEAMRNVLAAELAARDEAAQKLAADALRAVFAGLDDPALVAAAVRRALALQQTPDILAILVPDGATCAAVSDFVGAAGPAPEIDSALPPGTAEISTSAGRIVIDRHQSEAVALTLAEAPPSSDGGTGSA